jgi:hypothetical protein
VELHGAVLGGHGLDPLSSGTIGPSGRGADATPANASPASAKHRREKPGESSASRTTPCGGMSDDAGCRPEASAVALSSVLLQKRSASGAFQHDLQCPTPFDERTGHEFKARSSRRRVFPLIVFGTSSMNSIERGYLYAAICSLQNAINSSSVTDLPGLSEM